MKINFFDIILDHWATLRDYATGKTNWFDVVLLLLFPFILGLVLWCSTSGISENSVNVLITALSVFGGLLFNVIVILYTIMDAHKKNKEPLTDALATRNILLRETYANLAFTILLSIVIVVTLVAMMFVGKGVKSWLVFFSFSFLTMFVLTLLMVLKRLHTLFKTEFPKS